MSSSVLTQVNATTDKFAGLDVAVALHTLAILKWNHQSNIPAKYRIVDDAGKVYGDNLVAPNSTGKFAVKNLVPGSTTKFFIDRFELGDWVRQSSDSSLNYALVSTRAIALTVAVLPGAIEASFPNPISGINYRMDYVAMSDGAAMEAPLIVGADSATASISGLTKGETYKITLSSIESGDTSAIAEKIIKFGFKPVAMVAPNVGASIASLSWASPDGAEHVYRLMHRVDSSDTELTPPSKEMNVSLTGLAPGKAYDLVMQIQNGGNWEDVGEVIVTTVTTKLSVTSVMSRTIRLDWAPLYKGAKFEIVASKNGETEAMGQTLDTTQVVRDLESGTKYTMTLVVYEGGEPIGLSSLGMTTNSDGSEPLPYMKIGIVAAILLIVTFIIMRNL